MPTFGARWLFVPALTAALALVGFLPSRADSACCYFLAKEKEMVCMSLAAE